MVDEGLLAYKQVEEHKSWGKVFIVNPHFIRRGRYFKKFLGRTFDDITEEVTLTAGEAFK
ncbi:hypothetical protein U0L90_02835 [Flavobacteriaceae sp. LMIT009]